MLTVHAKRLQHNSTIVALCLSATEPMMANKPFHLAMVLDTSGSMEGPRLDSLQKTLRLLVDVLQPDDGLTLITYATEANRLCTRETDKSLLRAYIDSLTANGGTNMGAGITELRGTACVHEAIEATNATDVPDAVFLLTDGQVNQGIRSTEGLMHLLCAVLPRHVSVSTIGYGEDHAVDILQRLAVHSRGSYTYADAAEVLPTIVGNIVGGIREIAAASVVVEGIRGRCLELGEDEKNPQTYFVGSLSANKPQWVVLDLEAGCEELSIRSVIRGDGGERVHVQQVLIENPSHGNGVQADVQEQWFRARGVRIINGARRNTLNRMAAIGRLVDLERDIRDSTVAGRPLMLCMVAQIKEMLDMLESHAPMPGQAHAMMSNITTMGMQRGILSRGSEATVGIPDAQDLFASPTQRQVSAAMSQGFSQS